MSFDIFKVKGAKKRKHPHEIAATCLFEQNSSASDQVEGASMAAQR